MLTELEHEADLVAEVGRHPSKTLASARASFKDMPVGRRITRLSQNRYGQHDGLDDDGDNNDDVDDYITVVMDVAMTAG